MNTRKPLIALGRAARLATKACALAGGLAGCTAGSEEVRPPVDRIFFPTGVALSPDQAALFIANANSELRYDSGSVVVMRLDPVDAIADAWVTAGAIPAGCQVDPSQGETLICPEAVALDATAGVRLGNFATALGVLDQGDGTARVVTAVRGDPSLTWATWDGQTLGCGSEDQTFPLCDTEHRLTHVRNDRDLRAIPDEPYAVHTEPGSQVVLSTHMTTGSISLVDMDAARTPIVADVVTGLFLPDTSTNIAATTAIAGRTPNQPGGLIYVGSRSEDRVQMLSVVRPSATELPFLLPAGYFFLDAAGTNNGGSFDTRAMAFAPSGDELFLINREPPSLQVYDTSLTPTGVPANRALATLDICREASGLALLDAGDGLRAVVTCFRAGQLYIVDPRAGASIEAIVTVGRGPYAVTASASRQKLYVSNFLDDTIAVVEMAPDSPRRNQVVLRIGVPRS